jgi:hypothetical protein
MTVLEDRCADLQRRVDESAPQSEVEKAQNETAAVAAAWRETSIVRPFVVIV